MKKWFFEKGLPNIVQDSKIGWKLKKRIYSGKSKYQKIEILDTFALGRIFVLDGIVQLSEKYEFIYHEMISHLPLFYHPNPERILIIGGGDGGVLREVLKHSLKEIFWVELDSEVVEISKKHLSFLGIKNSLKQKKVKLFFGDGVSFVKKFKDFFDVIIVDSTDPAGPSLPLFQKRFYQNSFLALKKEGILITQSGNFLDQLSEIKTVIKNLTPSFPYVKVHRIFTPDYQGSDFSFTLASKKINLEGFNIKKIEKRYKKIKGLKYYSPKIHLASGILPKFYKEKLE
ncbi:MAG: polyamine aminopropyltransferase [Candidatus Nealsonbacteria bacterium]|nr:MAG: polyamine aminopropyltransferase [Candidatus Nealsonbacteria bacterium]